jgi:hypothetical protein
VSLKGESLAGLRAAVALSDDRDGGYFGHAAGVEPDFVDPVEEEEGAGVGDSDVIDGSDMDDDEIVARLAGEDGALGSLMERLMGWTLFRVEEDVESGDDGEPHETEHVPPAEVETRRRKRQQRADVLSSSNDNANVSKTKAEDVQSGWNDAAWLLSVASKVLL